VGDRLIDTDDEVEIDDKRSGILEVMKVGGKIVEPQTMWWIGGLRSWSIFLDSSVESVGGVGLG